MPYLFLLLVLGSLLSDAAAQGWQQTSGPEGGNVRSVAASADGKMVVAGLWNGNLYRTSESNPSWTALNPVAGLQSLTAQGSVLFAQSYEGLFQSYDFGNTWVPVVKGSNTTFFSPIIRGRDALYFVANDSVYRSSDAGENWNFAGQTGQGATIIGYADQEGADRQLIAAGGFTGFFSSDDRGATWTRSESGLPPNPMLSSMVTVYNNEDNEYSVWVSILNEGVYTWDASDGKWEKECDGLPQYGEGYPNFSKLVEAADRLYGVTEKMTYEFDFKIKEWKKAEHLVGKNLQGYGGRLYSATADGVEISTNGGTSWQKVGTNFRYATVRDFAVARKGVLAASQNGVFRTLDAGVTWTKTGDFYSEDLTAGHAVAYAESLDGVRRSTDDGLTWELANSGIGEELYHLSCVSANKDAVFAGFYDVFGFHGNSHWNSGGIFRSTNSGLNWTAVNNGLSNDGFADVPMNKIEAFDDVQFALALDGLYRSTNNGTRWTKASLGLDVTNEMLVDLVRNGNEVIAASTRSVFRSTDAGTTWLTYKDSLQTEMENHQALLVLVDTVILKSYDMMGQHRTYRLDRSTGRWVSYNMPQPGGADFTKFFPFGSTLYAGSNEHSVWTRSIEGQSSVTRDIANELGLQMYPNPFSSSTTVSFSLPRSSSVRAALYDVTGSLVLDLGSRQMQQGENTLQISREQLSAGTYICRLTTEEGVAEKQVVLLK
jgi:hypothetical protein